MKWQAPGTLTSSIMLQKVGDNPYKYSVKICKSSVVWDMLEYSLQSKGESSASYNTQLKKKTPATQWHNTVSTVGSTAVTHLESDMENAQISVGCRPRKRKGSASGMYTALSLVSYKQAGVCMR